MKHFLLMKRDGIGSDGRSLSARAAALKLLDAGVWPLWEHTRNRLAFSVGNKVAIYLSGLGQGLVVATAEVVAIVPWDRATARSYPLVLDGTPFTVLRLGKVRVLEEPVHVRGRLDRLSFVRPGAVKWGVAFMGGTRPLTEGDFQALTARQ